MSVTLYTGPMFSGKTSALISHYVEGETVAFKHSTDLRYVSTEEIVSHDGLRIPATKLRWLPSVKDHIFDGKKAVLIDEGQFFDHHPPDERSLNVACLLYAQAGLNVYVSALNGTSEMGQWKTVSDLIPICDEIHHLKAKLCMRCRKRAAPFTAVKRGELKSGQVLVGGSETYEPVCRCCFF